MADVDFPCGDSELLTMTRGESDRDHPRILVLTAVGELDQSSAGVFWEALSTELGPGRRVVLDLSAVTFFASVGVHLLLRARVRAQSKGAVFAVVVSPVVCRTLSLVGLMDALPVYPSRDAAQYYCAETATGPDH